MSAENDEHRSHAYVPVYDNREGQFNTLYCRPRLVLTDGTTLNDDRVLMRGWEEKPRVERIVADMLPTLTAGFSKAAKLAAEGSETCVIVPVHGMALTHKEIASEFTAACKAFPRESHQRVIFEVLGMTEEQSISFLDDVAIVLYSFCLTYGARVSPKAPNFKYYATCNYTGVSLAMLDREWPADKVRGYFERFVAGAEASRLKSYVHGVGTAEIKAITSECGVRFVSGVAVEEP